MAPGPPAVAPPGPQRLYAAASVADNQWVSDDPPMDSPATVEALLEWLALNDDTLALDAMREVFRQGKTFLDHDHTLRHFREWWRPRLIRWGSSESGSERAVLDRAREMWKDHLSRYEPPAGRTTSCARSTAWPRRPAANCGDKMLQTRRGKEELVIMTVLFLSVAGLALALMIGPEASAAEPIDIGSRLELFVDDHLIERLDGAELRLHQPTPQEIALKTDKPWEGNGVGYVTVFRDGPLYRMYYRGVNTKWKPEIVNTTQRYCYAESQDGIHWAKPDLGVVEVEGSKQNNVVWDGVGAHNFTPFKDANPNCQPDETYKALGSGPGGLFAFKSPDGIHWSLLSDQPVITQGAFDSQNLAFWDSVREEYREYHRDFRDGRDIRTCTSKDFLQWTDPMFLDYLPTRMYELYTNQITPYHRAPHLLLGFPTRYFDRGWTASTQALPQLDHRNLRATTSPREGTALTDGLFMTSRDGQTFHLWPEAFLRPGPQRNGTWFYGDHYQNWGVVETPSLLEGAPNELSIYATENTANQDDFGYLRRYTLRIDGFVSVHARASGGELITKPVRFSGAKLLINFATSVAGGIRVELLDVTGQPFPDFALEDCPVQFGDQLDRIVPWRKRADVGELAGRPVRLRFELKDADLYSFRFAE